MIELRSHLFEGDTVLQAIAEDLFMPDGSRFRISTGQLSDDPAVLKVQRALLDWRPDCLPQWGADGNFGTEAVAAVHRFKVEELGVSEAGMVDDVGPRTVVRLDQIRAQVEANAAVAGVTAAGVATDIPLVKFYGDPPDALPPAITVDDELFGSYEVANLGTAPTTASDQVWCSVMTQSIIYYQARHILNDPPVGPGETYRGGVRLRGSELPQFLGAWEIEFFVTDASGQVVDSATVPFDLG
jgi:hypothetical protein